MIQAYQKCCQERVDSVLTRVLQAKQPKLARLYEAMYYSVMNGGKRVRPLLAYAACEAVGGAMAQADAAASAIELIHAYSLVHDDLPAMDDDDLRRGKPTTHIAYDEACAILAGDGLQSLAFEVLSSAEFNPCQAQTRLNMVLQLAQAAGPNGMVGGQAIDLGSVGKHLTPSDLEHMHRHKTGALICAATYLGALASEKASRQQLESLHAYSQHIGLAFQVQDDILDVITDTSTLGKRQGSDIEHNKPTYPALMGLDNAKEYAQELKQQAISAITRDDLNAAHLIDLAEYIVNRNH
ncbi:farnesyl diphosphate synthase [Pseudomonas sp. F1_0610]|uniref:(2E,6E)-farnesyl diphosphate synthase n=1 Tax=Pseudomonas sp. F1_0610 TaxID=3114284 RepID=UPI0039C486CD